ncbi:hypothetical protein ACFQ60_22420 [Streptomyces zhihengii]
MALEAFASVDDLEARTLRDLTDVERQHAPRLLADASNLIRMTAGYQQISRVVDDTVLLRGSGTHVLVLPQRPVAGWPRWPASRPRSGSGTAGRSSPGSMAGAGPGRSPSPTPTATCRRRPRIRWPRRSPATP